MVLVNCFYLMLMPDNCIYNGKHSHTDVLKSQVVFLLAGMLGWEIKCLKSALLLWKPVPSVSLHSLILCFLSLPYWKKSSVAWSWKHFSATADFKNQQTENHTKSKKQPQQTRSGDNPSQICLANSWSCGLGRIQVLQIRALCVHGCASCNSCTKLLLRGINSV